MIKAKIKDSRCLRADWQYLRESNELFLSILVDNAIAALVLTNCEKSDQLELQ